MVSPKIKEKWSLQPIVSQKKESREYEKISPWEMHDGTSRMSINI